MKGERRWLRAMAAAIGMASAAPAAAGGATQVEVRQTPAPWLTYAGHVQQKVADWLAAPEAPAALVRGYVHAAAAPGQPPAPIDLKIWIDAGGRVVRVEFVGFAHDEANLALGQALAGRDLGKAPPADMPTPLRVRVTVEARTL